MSRVRFPKTFQCTVFDLCHCVSADNPSLSEESPASAVITVDASMQTASTQACEQTTSLEQKHTSVNSMHTNIRAASKREHTLFYESTEDVLGLFCYWWNGYFFVCWRCGEEEHIPHFLSEHYL